jgi:MFS family permease
VIIGLLYSSFSLMQFIFAPIWGRISDRVGRRPILLLGLAGSVLFYGLFGVASGMPSTTGILLMFVARIGAGICGASLATAQAVIADSTPPEKRAAGMAIIGAAFGIGFTFGPLIAFGAVTFFPEEHRGPGFLAAGLSLVSLLLGLWLLPETLRTDSPRQQRPWLDLSGMYSTLYLPTIGILVLSSFLAIFGFAKFEATLSLLTLEAFGYTNEDNFLIFAYVGFSLMLAQGLLYRRLAKKMDEVRLMRIGVVLMLLGMASLGMVAAIDSEDMRSIRLWWFFITLAVAVTGFSFLNPSVGALISRRTDPARQGEVLGVNQSFGALARILGPVLGLFLFKLEATHMLPYVAASILLLVVLVLSSRLTNPHNGPVPSTNAIQPE